MAQKYLNSSHDKESDGMQCFTITKLSLYKNTTSFYEMCFALNFIMALYFKFSMRHYVSFCKSGHIYCIATYVHEHA